MKFLGFVLFCVFFAAGVGAIALSILVDEAQSYYNSKDLLAKTESDNEKVQSLDADYDVLIKHIQQNPQVLKRLKRVTLGQEPQTEDTVFPKVSQQQLEAASQALLGDLQSSLIKPCIPQWLRHCAEPRSRHILFFSGAGLVLVAFVFFGTPSRKLTTSDTSLQSNPIKHNTQ